MSAKLRWLCVLSIVGGGSCLSASPHVHPDQAAADSAFEQEMMQSMSKMDREMGAAPMTGDPDHDFSAMMIPHHQGAIDMAKTFLLHGQDPALRRLAQEIIVTQQQEIALGCQDLTEWSNCLDHLAIFVPASLGSRNRPANGIDMLKVTEMQPGGCMRNGATIRLSRTVWRIRWRPSPFHPSGTPTAPLWLRSCH